uniref:Fungal lipase-type domain-containing protein n=6 Tax=Aegilops tauschii subsp. strangulata TaxID=200361 RepID=A0A453E3F6_AEGTS
MGAAIAAILTYILRENKKLSSSSCIAFGPAACMSWDLAESSKDFVTTVVNKNDLVPSFGKVSASELRTKVMASSWAPGLQEHIQQKRLLSFINHSLDLIRSYIPFVSSPSSKVADVGMLRSCTTKAGMKHSKGVHKVVKKHSA